MNPLLRKSTIIQKNVLKESVESSLKENKRENINRKFGLKSLKSVISEHISDEEEIKSALPEDFLSKLESNRMMYN